MKDEEFQGKLEKILERFEEIDRDVREYLESQKTYALNRGYGLKRNWEHSLSKRDKYLGSY